MASKEGVSVGWEQWGRWSDDKCVCSLAGARRADIREERRGNIFRSSKEVGQHHERLETYWKDEFTKEYIEDYVIIAELELKVSMWLDR